MTDMIHKADKMTIKTSSRDCEHNTRGVAYILPRVLVENCNSSNIAWPVQVPENQGPYQKKQLRHVLGEFVRELGWTLVDA